MCTIDILTWLGQRYAEKCEFEISKSYYKKVRDLTAPVLDMKDTLMLWRPQPVKGSTGANTEEGRALIASIKDNICKGHMSEHSHNPPVPKRLDYSSFGGKHDDSHTVVYTVPKQGWNTVTI